MSKELKVIRQWMKKSDKNTKTKLAAMLNYSSSVVITMWFKRNNVPLHKRAQLMEVITNDNVK